MITALFLLIFGMSGLSNAATGTVIVNPAPAAQLNSTQTFTGENTFKGVTVSTLIVGLPTTETRGIVKVKQKDIYATDGITIEALETPNTLVMAAARGHGSLSTSYGAGGSISNLLLNEYGGNVGIGNDGSPTAKLVVNGNIVSSGTIYAQNGFKGSGFLVAPASFTYLISPSTFPILSGSYLISPSTFPILSGSYASLTATQTFTGANVFSSLSISPSLFLNSKSALRNGIYPIASNGRNLFGIILSSGSVYQWDESISTWTLLAVSPFPVYAVTYFKGKLFVAGKMLSSAGALGYFNDNNIYTPISYPSITDAYSTTDYPVDFTVLNNTLYIHGSMVKYVLGDDMVLSPITSQTAPFYYMIYTNRANVYKGSIYIYEMNRLHSTPNFLVISPTEIFYSTITSTSLPFDTCLPYFDRMYCSFGDKIYRSTTLNNTTQMAFTPIYTGAEGYGNGQLIDYDNDLYLAYRGNPNDLLVKYDPFSQQFSTITLPSPYGMSVRGTGINFNGKNYFASDNYLIWLSNKKPVITPPSLLNNDFINTTSLSVTRSLGTEKSLITPYGGYAVRIWNDEAASVSSGTVVNSTGSAVDYGFKTNPIGGFMPTGVVYGSTDTVTMGTCLPATWCWVVVSGIAYVKGDSTYANCDRGAWAGASNTTAGTMECLAAPSEPPSSSQHDREIGHVITNNQAAYSWILFNAGR